jgi:hypothetical protein
MKKAALSAWMLLSIAGAFAQNLDKAKELLKNKKLSEAKTQIDGFLAVDKNAKNAEGWYTKAKIYSDIAADKGLSASTPDARWQSFEAIQKYISYDDKKQILLQLDGYKPIMDVYQGYFKDGAELYNAGDYKAAYPNFKNCLSVSEYMTAQKWSTVTLDTSVILYTGISAEKAEKRDDAAIYYGKLADGKVAGEGMGEIYKWLVDYHSKKGNAEAAQKYLSLGKELYPKDPFWDDMDMEMARSKGDKKALFAKYESTIASDPNNYVNRYNYAIEMYEEGYKPVEADRPANSTELIKKTEEQLKKAVELKPDYVPANLVLGQLYYNQAIDLNNQAKAIKVVAPATKLKPEEQKKKDDLRAQMTKKFDDAIPYLEKVDQTLDSQPKLKSEEKGFLKNSLDLLITIYDQKGNKEKVKFYEEKFNNVDKKH